MEATLRQADAAAAGDDEDDMAWALELEEELDLAGCIACGDANSRMSPPSTAMAVLFVMEAGASSSTTPIANSTNEDLEQKPAVITACASEQKPPSSARLSVAAALPQEVLANIIAFGQVGRVCKSWSLASVAVARRRFSSRLAAILLPLDSNAALVALDVEAELYAAYGQRNLTNYSLAKAYGHKARTLLFNLKDSRNADLRNRLLSGELPAHSLVRMSGPDMANPQLVRQRKEWIRKRTHEVMRDGREVDGFESDLFECRNCGSSRTRYRQWRRKAIVDRTRIIVICLRSHTALTDGNEIVLELLSANARANADASKVQALPLLWGDHASAAAFERAFPHPVDVLIGADVVCWPMLVKPILQTIKYLLLRSREPLETRFCCGFVCRAQSTEDLFFREAVAFGFRFERVPAEAFLPTPRPAVVTSNLELQLLVFTLDATAPNWKHPVVFSDAELTDLQTAC
ncbi:hypothetical protein BBJ28_00014576 [Nothophytophthora sp. Chile5]|nr:hypothetical protein BBJ28_00014576 [Nothophytophthora sp. Chile5]